MNQLAESVVERLTVRGPVQFAVSMSLTPIILQLLIALLPIVQDCIKKDDVTPEDVQQLAAYRGPGWRLMRARLLLVVRASIEDADRTTVREIADTLTEMGQEPQYAAMFLGVTH